MKYLDMVKEHRSIASIAAGIQPGENVLMVTYDLKTFPGR